MIRSGRLNTVLVALVLVCSTQAGADYEAGQRAWDAGQRDKALAEWRSGAEAGEAKAMLALGRLYVQGLGVPQNYVQAHMWFNLAASRGEATAVAERNTLAEQMTEQQIAEAQKLALEWQPGGSPARAGAAPAPGAQSSGPPARAVREAQGLLAELGYQPGPADGMWGGRTTEAFQAFLRDAGQPPADTLTPEALRALRAMAQRRGAATAQPATAPPARRPTRPDALLRAAQAGDINGLQAALATGVDVNARDARGWTALMHAANKGYTLMVPLLLEAKADLNVRAADGATALFMAVLHSYTEIAGSLLKAGADISIRGPKSRTALDVAKVQGHAEIIALLERAAKDDAAFAQTKSTGTVAAYRRYAQLYPNGRHADEMRRGLLAAEEQEAAAREEERLIYEQAKSVDTVAAYEGYLSTYPEGSFRAPASARVGELLEPVFTQRNAAVEVGKVFRDCRRCPEMVVVPAGSYRMGSPSYEDEGPVHRVTIGEPFAVGVYEVTLAQWDSCVRDGGCSHRLKFDRDRANYPVVNVNWTDVQQYVGWLAGETGQAYRLLSEAEWEYVARAGTTTQYWWGDEIGHNRASCNGCGGQWDGKRAPVGSFGANAFGLYDIHGNVWEWVQDCWNESYAGAPTDGSAWGRGDCSRRVLRGGSWFIEPRKLRSANRSWYTTDFRLNYFDFRLARSLP